MTVQNLLLQSTNTSANQIHPLTRWPEDKSLCHVFAVSPLALSLHVDPWKLALVHSAPPMKEAANGINMYQHVATVL